MNPKLAVGCGIKVDGRQISEHEKTNATLRLRP